MIYFFSLRKIFDQYFFKSYLLYHDHILIFKAHSKHFIKINSFNCHNNHKILLSPLTDEKTEAQNINIMLYIYAHYIMLNNLKSYGKKQS